MRQGHDLIASVHTALDDSQLAKGALMLAYRLTPEAAFDVLSWHSQHGNRKLHLVAADLVTAVQADDIGGNRLRARIDKILADIETAHNANGAR